ncbi:DUF1573 domain-containing protein [Parabacteroides sp. 52]|uniref:DUF1573 domain-containing protein n=1 Tax=unclassified Parabacteroides TaxID=2649774 RepID=UPI0013D2DE1B|nr:MULTISPECIES: DUF1573 domain-containing protein [unclassified Parabacteroides]MDH6535516.1 hypothetical protein [Parabacteroides sp. PM5-20]NDV56483.1 DUF1573 domain-containing protein [Parabacteroides sp. 52]
MKKIIFICMAILLTTGSVFAQEAEKVEVVTPPQETEESGAVIATEEASYDFGDIKEADGKVSHTFEISNKGKAPLVMTRVIASCGCTTPEWTKEPIAPGKTGTVKITFDPAHRPGPFAKPVSVYSNGKAGSFMLTIRGNVIHE